MAEPAAVMDRAAAPAACSHQVTPPRLQLDSEKSSAALMISGLFLGLVGTAFTALGWQNYNMNTAFDWTQLFGPFLITVGGMFMLTGVCRFGVVSCVARNEDVTESARHAFTLNHQVMLHNAVVCIPPSYNFMQPELSLTSEVSSGSPVTPSELPPQYDTLCTDYRAPEGTEAHVRSQKTLEEPCFEAETSHTCESPPAYEDIYPSTI